MTVVRTFLTSSCTACLLVLCAAALASADEVKVLCSNGFREVLRDLLPRFEAATRHSVAVTYGLSTELTRRIDGGEPYDLAILTPALIGDLAKRGRIEGNDTQALARSIITIAVKTGARKPDVSSVAAVTRALRDARSIAYAREGASAAYFRGLLDRLSLASVLSTVVQPLASGAAVGAAVARGDAQYGVLPLSEILPIHGIEAAGPLPVDLRGDITMTAGIGASAKSRTAARALMTFLASPAADSVLRQKGMERAY